VTSSTPTSESVSPGRRGPVGAWLAVLAFLVVWFAPLPLELRAHRLAAIFVAVIVLWVSEAIPIAATALLIAPAMIACGVTDETAAFAPYASPLLYLFVGGFMIARSMTRHGLDRRLALGMASMRGIAGSANRIRVAFAVTGMMLSMWISNTATTAILIPIFLGFAGEGETPGRARATTGGLLAIAYACSIGGLGTPVGSPPNLIAMGFLRDEGIAFEFVDWVAVGLPTALVLTVATLLFFHWRSPAPRIEDDTAVRPAFGPLSRGERVTALSFAIAVVGWMVPGLLKAAGHPWGAPLEAALPGGAVALIATVPLFLVPARSGSSERVLPWPEAARIDWGIILLFGGGISLGRQMFDTGLAAALARGFVDWTGVSDMWVLTGVVIVFTIFFTEVCSNTATSNMLSPLVIAIAQELEISPIPPVLGVGLAASCAFMLPIATGPNAIAYGTGRIPQGSMIRAGFALNLICAGLLFVLLRVLTPLLGWA
jgi:sodium-dependent dicarboxylate transporter 2/3/5